MRRIGLACLLLLSACRTPPKLPPVDLAQPGWQVRQGQAVWKPNAKGPELSGELLWAAHPDGRFLLQFLKTPITLVEAQGGREAWQISFPPQRRTVSGSRGPAYDQKLRSGRRSPHPGLGWLHLASALQQRPLPADWTFTPRNNRSWQLTHARTGEMIEGYLAP